jgi:hypothetical protein
MPIESNTGSDIGQDSLNTGSRPVVKMHYKGETRRMQARETPRERMIRVVQTVRKKQRKRAR